ncbi:nucleotide pyrophosphohydrolase [Achromobacter arsenitoxydans]|uniref:MazG nucleotide pyrophosphohydrolase domain-containing protein n=1 Tax=Achromobacter arsenitoxydans SY8 TaxID=477184 RepID=H0F0C4_9BURK|nr:nucleotide pyrophosphohydrolase [Achromobacter arsenitoxydans]EHK68180.1 MazG nucleotide pyrophosphohydrolase domain-containing protein [Achromobacter arsenitoxydans SY8]
MSDLQEIKLALRQFTAEREWQQFHSPKNLAMALAGETGELVALFQWLSEEQSRNLPAERLADAADEIADVQMYLVALADQLGVDIAQAVAQKMVKNAGKYPADRFRRSARKYDDPPQD